MTTGIISLQRTPGGLDWGHVVHMLSHLKSNRREISPIIFHEGSSRRVPHGHLRSTWLRPPSSYSCLEIHICWNDPRDPRIEPPIQAPNRRSELPWALISFKRMFCGENDPARGHIEPGRKRQRFYARIAHRFGYLHPGIFI